jgi:hypothetical protein
MTLETTTPITTDQLRAAANALPKPTAGATTPYHQPVRGGDVLDAEVQLDAVHTPATHVVFELVPLPGAVSDDTTVSTHVWRFTGLVRMEDVDRVQVTADNPLKRVLYGVLTQAGADEIELDDARIYDVKIDRDLGDGLVKLIVLTR